MAWSLILCLLPLATLAAKTQTNEYLQPYKFVKPLKSLAELYNEAELQEEDRTVKKSDHVEHGKHEENVEKVPIAEARSGVAHPIVGKEGSVKNGLMSADMMAPKKSSEALPQAQPLKEPKARTVRTRKRVQVEKQPEEEEEEMKDMASNISNHRTEDKKEKEDDTEIGPKAEALKGRPPVEYYEDDEYYYDDEYSEYYEDYEEYEEYYEDEEPEADIPIGRPSYSNFPPTKPKNVKPPKSLTKPVKKTPEPKRSSNISKPGSYSQSKPKSYSSSKPSSSYASSKPSSYSSTKPSSYSSSKPSSYSSSKPGSYSPKSNSYSSSKTSSYSPSKPKSYSQSKPSSYSPSKHSPHYSSKSSPYSSKYPKKPSQPKSPYKKSYNIASTLERLKAIKQTQLKRKGLPALPNPWERFNMKSPPKSSAKSSHRPDYRKPSDDRKSKPKPVKPYSDYYEDDYYYDYPSETRNIARQGYGGPVARQPSNPLALLIAPLAGIALLTAAAAVAINPVLVTVSVTGKRRKRRDLDTVVGGNQGVTPELEEKIHEMKVLEKFMSTVPENTDYQQQVLSMYLSCSGYTEMTNHCLDRVVCEYANSESEVSQEERDVISIVLYNIMANEFVSEDYKDRLRVAARSGRDSATCLAFECSALSGIVGNDL